MLLLRPPFNNASHLVCHFSQMLGFVEGRIHFSRILCSTSRVETCIGYSARKNVIQLFVARDRCYFFPVCVHVCNMCLVLCWQISVCSWRVTKPALRTIGNIVCAEDDTDYTQHIIDAGAVPCLQQLIAHSNREIQKEVRAPRRQLQLVVMGLCGGGCGVGGRGGGGGGGHNCAAFRFCRCDNRAQSNEDLRGCRLTQLHPKFRVSRTASLPACLPRRRRRRRIQEKAKIEEGDSR